MKINLQTAKQNQKISFPFLFPLRGGGVGGGDARKMQGNFFGFCTRESASVSEAHWFASPGNRSVRFGSKPPRAPRVRISQNPADFSRNTFELRPIHTAKIENPNRKPKWGRAAGATQTHSRQKFLNPKGFSTLRVAPRLPIQFYE
jgi:hypothetical protein